MRSDKTNVADPVPARPFYVNTQLICHYCREAVLEGASRTVLDDSGSLAITAWTCGRCGGLSEEICLLAKDGQARARPIRYVVGQPTVSSLSGDLRH